MQFLTFSILTIENSSNVLEFFNYVIGKNLNYILLKFFLKFLTEYVYQKYMTFYIFEIDTITEYAYEVIREKFNIMKRVLKENFFSICLLK